MWLGGPPTAAAPPGRSGMLRRWPASFLATRATLRAYFFCPIWRPIWRIILRFEPMPFIMPFVAS
ncbi:MAG: hypothetical protein QOG31_1897 [Thermoplasmata archaeon]|nr:hypothetical protein [Thermoplasmata archaeon]